MKGAMKATKKAPKPAKKGAMKATKKPAKEPPRVQKKPAKKFKDEVTYERSTEHTGRLGGVWHLAEWMERWVLVQPPPVKPPP